MRAMTAPSLALPIYLSLSFSQSLTQSLSLSISHSIPSFSFSLFRPPSLQSDGVCLTLCTYFLCNQSQTMLLFCFSPSCLCSSCHLSAPWCTPENARAWSAVSIDGGTQDDWTLALVHIVTAITQCHCTRSSSGIRILRNISQLFS